MGFVCCTSLLSIDICVSFIYEYKGVHTERTEGITPIIGRQIVSAIDLYATIQLIEPALLSM